MTKHNPMKTDSVSMGFDNFYWAVYSIQFWMDLTIHAILVIHGASTANLSRAFDKKCVLLSVGVLKSWSPTKFFVL